MKNTSIEFQSEDIIKKAKQYELVLIKVKPNFYILNKKVEMEALAVPRKQRIILANRSEKALKTQALFLPV